jgi:phosphatidate cytidylyltransferase
MSVLLFGVFVAAPFLCLIAGMRGELRNSLPASALSVFPVLYIGVSLATLIFIRVEFDGVFWIVVLFAAVWAGDSVAMYVGKSLGRHKLAPRISPGKTWEGSAGSVVGSLIFCFVAYVFRSDIVAYGTSSGRQHLPRLSLPVFLAVVILLNIAGQVGDLVESVIKRGANVKDSGTLLPGHGGVLDRIDALLFAAPVLWYYLAIFRS